MFRDLSEWLRLEVLTGEKGTIHPNLQDIECKYPNLNGFPKEQTKIKENPNAKESKRKLREPKRNKKKQTPQGGGRWPRPPCLSALAWGREDIS